MAADSTGRVLHLVESGALNACGWRLLADLIESLDAVCHEVLLVGTRNDRRLAEAVGIELVGFLPKSRNPLSRPGRNVRAWIAAREGAGRRCDLIHSWIAGGGMIDERGEWRTRPMVLTLTRMLRTNREAGRVRVLLGMDNVSCTCLSRTWNESPNENDSDSRRLEYIRPGVKVDDPSPAIRDHYRKRWGVDDDAFVVGVTDEPIEECDARVAVESVHRLRATGRHVVLVLPDRALRRVEAERFARAQKCREGLVFDAVLEQPWTCAAGLDAAFLFKRPGTSPARAGVLPMMWMMAAGVPIIAGNGSAPPSEHDDEAAEALLEPIEDFKAIYERVAVLYDDPDQQKRMSEQARAIVRKHFTVERFAQKIGEQYRNVMAGDSD